MNNGPSKIKTLFILLGFSLLFLIPFILYSIKSHSAKQSVPFKSFPTPTGNIIVSQPILSKKNSVVSSKPNPTQEIESGKQQVFKITFSYEVSVSQFRIQLLQSDISNNSSPNPTTTQNSIDSDKKTLVITTSSVILPYKQYSLSVFDQKNNEPVYQESFLSSSPSPTPVSSNNPSLAQYLPYKKTSYNLSYDPKENIYIFHFLYDSSSALTIDVQFENAKTDALNFIKSKNIDPSSLTIDWRHS